MLNKNTWNFVFPPQKNAKNFTLFSLRAGGGVRERLIARLRQKHDSEEGRTTEIESAIY